MRKIVLLSLLFTAILISTSCKKDSTLEKEDVAYSYFPYTPGYYVMYDVDSTRYDDFFDTIYHYKFKVAEYCESYFTDSEGRQSIRIERWYKMNDTCDWKINDVWFSCKTNTYAERTEENIRFTKLIFPLKKNSKWDGNAYNTNDEEMYKCTVFDEAHTVGSLYFDSTATIIHASENNLIQEIDKQEIYARNVGLIHKTEKDIEKDFVTGEIKSGVDVKYNIISYGQYNQ